MKPNNIRGLYAITADEPDTGKLLADVGAALRGGARLLQYRNKRADAALAAQQAIELRTLCSRYDACLIINDDPKLAQAVGADGVHLGKSDGALAEARQILGPASIIGISCYNELALAAAAQQQGADYIAFGACFTSSTKPEAVRADLGLFAQAKAYGLPIVGIGGIQLDNASQVTAAGADAVAVIGALWSSGNIEQTARAFSHLTLQH